MNWDKEIGQTSFFEQSFTTPSLTLITAYSYVSNKRACALILFENIMHPCKALFEPARLLILEEIVLPARLLKPAPFLDSSTYSE